MLKGWKSHCWIGDQVTVRFGLRLWKNSLPKSALSRIDYGCTSKDLIFWAQKYRFAKFLSLETRSDTISFPKSHQITCTHSSLLQSLGRDEHDELSALRPSTMLCKVLSNLTQASCLLDRLALNHPMFLSTRQLLMQLRSIDHPLDL